MWSRRMTVRSLLGLGAALLAAPGEAASPAEGASPPLAPSVGDVIPEFEARGIDGTVQRLSFSGGPTVLLFFLSGCPTCHQMIPEWNRAFERRPAGLDVVGVLMDQEPPGFFQTMPIAFPVVRSPGRSFLQRLNVNRAPLTLRVGPGGRVEDSAMGIVDPITLGQVFRK